MSDQLVTLERRDDGVALVTLSRPKVNALNTELLSQLEAITRELTADPPGAVVVTGGQRVFAAGADISEFGGPDKAKVVGQSFRRALDGVAAIPRPVIAAVNGVALGGGCELAMACDLRIVADNARFGQPEILLGIIPGGGGTQRLTRLVGLSRAKNIVWSGRMVDAEEALRIGLADRVVPAEEVLAAALDWAGEFARGAVVAQGLAKIAMNDGLDGSLSDGLDLELESFEQVFGTNDAKVGVASFLEHGPGKAQFKGR